MTIEHLNQVNDITIQSVSDKAFETYGRIVSGYDFSPLIDYMELQTEIPESGNVYVPSVEEMESEAVAEQLMNRMYGGMPIEIGYCNGRNSTYNGFEYHKGSEINIAVTDLMLVLGHTWLISSEMTYLVEDAEVFFVPKGTAIEFYQTTLHLSPCKVCDAGFKAVVVLPRGTNTPLTDKPLQPEGEDKLLLMKNKWVIAHPEREPLIKQGAFPGLIGPNKELFY